MATPADRDSLAFVDTNVLVYAFDLSEATKRGIADVLLLELLAGERLVLSAQVLNEFYWTVTRPNRVSPLTHEDAMKKVADFAADAQVVPIDAALCLTAIEAVGKYRLAFWDALIWAAAKTAGCPTIYSEDFQNGQTLEGVTFVNPFA